MSTTAELTRDNASAPAVDLTDLQSSISGRVVTDRDRDWDAVREVFNLTTDLRPAAMVLPRTVEDVVVAVGYAREHGLRVAAQATGHNAAAYGDLSDALLIDMRDFREIDIDASAHRVRVGAGVRWQDVVPALSDLGLAALHGSSPLVGIAGYSLGGGIGWLARKHGMQANAVVALQIVTADGRIRRVDAEHDPDLFWALRGGNGNFGVVTAIEFRVFPAVKLYAGNMFFPLARAHEVLTAWTALAPSLPDEMMTWASLLQFPDLPDVPEPMRGRGFTVLHGAFLGDQATGEALLRPIRDLVPEIDTYATVPPVQLSEQAMDPTAPLPIHSTTALVDDVTPEALANLLAAVGPDSGSPLPLVQIRHMGGALGRPPAGAGARATLPGAYCIFALGVPADQAVAALVADYLSRVDRAVAPYRVGAYPNFVEAHSDASGFFDADTWARLRTVKSGYDPGDLFRGNHRIPPVSAQTAIPYAGTERPRRRSADLPRSEAMLLAEEAYARFADVVETIREDQWELSTDCQLWDVRALVGHVLGAMRSAASMREMRSQQREITSRVARYGGGEVDTMTQVQVERTAGLDTDQLVAQVRALVGPAARGRRRTPAPMRRLASMAVDLPGIQERWTIGYLVDVVLTRDAWLHKIDLCRALGVEPGLTAEHDGQIVADVAREWLSRHGTAVDLILDGPAGGRFGHPEAPRLRLDAVEFCRILSGRGPASGLLAVPVPF